ncbi:hypothetical protein BCR39DRAFT_557568 [Naematelia encephala]|uniref:Uncharacterized protein n=1 Tax=Naematelia encephala TaxID=71784 RepID=A0A1Y2BCU5_9TREE|nr:hypothetical protein BCR39DRAFT_557568 [Naematelia encephala]
MSFTKRALTLRLPLRTVPQTQTQVRYYAENKSAMEQAGDVLKKVGQAFKSDGAVGKEFNADGAVGSKGEAVGGPFSKDGTIGKEFTDSGAVGGNVEKAATDAKKEGQNVKSKA